MRALFAAVIRRRRRSTGRGALFDLSQIPNPPPRWNIAPTQAVPTVRAGEAGPYVVMTRRDSISSWAKDPSVGTKVINARLETVREKPPLKATFRRWRCRPPDARSRPAVRSRGAVPSRAPFPRLECNAPLPRAAGCCDGSQPSGARWSAMSTVSVRTRWATGGLAPDA